VGLEQLTAEGECAIVEAEVLLNFVGLKSDDGLEDVRRSLEDEVLFL